MKRMQTPQSREEFEHNINLVIEETHGLDKASEDERESFRIFTYPNLKKLKFLPNGRINLNTVDEELRLHANSKNHLSKMMAFGEESEG